MYLLTMQDHSKDTGVPFKEISSIEGPTLNAFRMSTFIDYVQLMK